jgi:ATP-dependent Clp protease ATP-binding subunit ClpC
VFRALDKDDNRQILKILLKEVTERVSGLSMRLGFTEEMETFLVDRGCDLKYGARPLRRTIHRYIENPLAEAILKGSFNKGDDISTVCGKNEDNEDCAIFNIVGTFEVKEPEPSKEPPIMPKFDDPPILEEEE